MPEVFRKQGYVFFFYSNENREPMHIYVRKAGGFAKFWMEPIELDYSSGLKTKEVSKAEQLLAETQDLVRRKWHEVFDS